MLTYLLVVVLVVTKSPVYMSAGDELSDVDERHTHSSTSCRLTLPVGCSCVKDRTAVSVQCADAQMTSRTALQSVSSVLTLR